MVRQSLAPEGKLAQIFSSASLAVSWNRFNADMRIPHPPYNGGSKVEGFKERF